MFVTVVMRHYLICAVAGTSGNHDVLPRKWCCEENGTTCLKRQGTSKMQMVQQGTSKVYSHAASVI
jgi:hypothetical protein